MCHLGVDSPFPSLPDKTTATVDATNLLNLKTGPLGYLQISDDQILLRFQKSFSFYVTASNI
jgi:hypothetical protein